MDPPVVPLVPLVPLVLDPVDELPVPYAPPELELDPEPIEAFVNTNCPSLPLERLALVLPPAPVEPVVEPVDAVPDVPVAPPLHESALTRQPVTVTLWPRLD
ncbi:MAG: hypothetical protein HOQ29_17595 [Acidobacteria bacterium]|nr:hypothetical protein [Acidobacteriota bacterium]